MNTNNFVSMHFVFACVGLTKKFNVARTFVDKSKPVITCKECDGTFSKETLQNINKHDPKLVKCFVFHYVCN